MLSPKTVGATSGFGGMLELAPDEFVAEHYHPYSEEFLYLVSGSVEMTIDGAVHRLEPGDSIMVPIGARHRLVNVGEENARGVFHLSPLAPEPRLGHIDTEPLPNPAESGPSVGGP
nr:cupin domain-containing protein [Amycolatopsis arida]